MKCKTCNTDISDDVKFCFECGSAISHKLVVLCSGRQGIPCGAELQENFKFCQQCGKKVDQSMFQKKQTPCKGIKEDGSVCGTLLDENNKFCMECGTPRPTVPFISLKENISFSSQKTIKTNDSSIAAATPGAESAQDFGLHVEVDGQSIEAAHTEQTFVTRFPVSSTEVLPGSELVFGFSASLDGDTRKEENAGESPLPSHSFPQDSLILGQLRVFKEDSKFDIENIQHSSISSSPDSVTIHENCLDNDDSEEDKGNFASSVESASRNISDVENKLNNVTLSEERGNDFEVVSDNGSGYDTGDDEGDNKCTDDSSPDSTDTEWDEDEVEMPTPPESVEAQNQKRTGPKRKKQQQHTSMQEKKKKTENIKNRPHLESLEQLQETQQKTRMEVDEDKKHTWPVEGQVHDLQHMQGSILVDDHSTVDVGSGLNSTNQMEIDECKTPIQRAQDLESDNACGEEKKSENKNEDQFEDINSKLDKVPIPETGMIQNLDLEEGTEDTVPKMDKPADENSNEKTVKTDKENLDAQKDSEGSKLSKNEKNKKSKDSKTKTSQNTSSVDGAASGTGTGTNANQRKNSEFIHVHFHALLSPEFDLTPMDIVLVKFGEDELGGWTSERHISKIVRKADDQYTEFKLDLDIPKKLIFKGKKILYKYLVLKDKTQKDKQPKYMWEHYHADNHVNRTFDLPEKGKILAEWHQYDGIVFPKPGEGFIDKLKNFLTGNVHEREKRDLVHSIQYFLPKFFQDLNNGQLPQMLADEALVQLEGLLLSLKRVYCIDRKAISVISDYERKITDILLAPVLRTFEGVPLCNWKENLAESERRMLQATTLVFAHQIFKLQLNQEEQELLARGLLVRPNHETCICHDLNCIDRYFPSEKKKQLSDSLHSFLESMALKAKSPFILFGIPLYHFLTGVLKPFDKMPEDFSHNNEILTWWGTERLNSVVNIVMKGGPFKWTMKLEQIVGILHPLFEMDYLLPRTFMAMLLLDELVEVIKTGKIPFEICAATIFYYVKVIQPSPTGYFILMNEDMVITKNAIYALGDVCRAVQIPDESSRSDVIQARMFYKISADLLNATLGQVLQSLVAGAAQIFLHAVAVYDIMQRSGNSQKPNTRQNSEHLTTLSRLYEGVRNWHGSRFIYWITSLENYLKCWDSILAPVDIPSAAVKEAWNTEAEKYLNNILRFEMQKDTYGVLTNQLIHLYCAKVDTFHPNVQNCLSQLAFKAIETGYTVQFQQLGERERARFGKLLSDLFQSSWNAAMKRKDVEDRLILHHTLKWTPFSHFLKMFYGEERKMYLLSQNYILELTQAISVIDQRISSLEDGAITFRDLDVIKEAEDKFLELTMIMFEKSDKKKGKNINVAKALKVRQKEVDSYHTQKKYVKTLVFLCQGIHSVQCAELDSTIKNLDEKNDLCIKDICIPANVEITAPDKFQPQITAFRLSDKVISMLEPLHASCNGNIFLELWRDTGHMSGAVTFDDVYEHIWKPVFFKLKDITQTVVTGEIQFVDMERYLGNIYKEDYDQMVKEMILINVPKGHGDERVKQLRQFRQLEACFHGAETILKVADAYRLGGDFEAVKTIASLENAADKKMKEFDDSLLTTCGFLEELTSEKTNCLDHFITCEPLIQWLRKSMKGGLKELKVFVDLAMISAGEGDMEIDKVNCLHAATTGYASLIFDLDEDSGYEKLLEKCQILWKELKADPDLPKKLLDTNRHLEWLKMVKQAHGSIEVTSLAQAKAINSKGIICVGTLNTTNTARNTTMGLDLQNTLQLTVPDNDNESHGHRQYTFEQLQDLQSRLMLVAGRAEQGKDDVDRFMLVSDSVMRLANVFIKLNSAGCVLFKHWQAKFLCDRNRSICAFIEFGQGAKPLKEKQTKKDDVTTVIPKLANFMKNCLDEWIGHISQIRSKYFELNYFTTDQLVILQQELVKVGPNHDLDIRIFPLLSAVKENCTYEDLVDAMRKASDGMEMDEECKEMECAEEVEVASSEIKEEERQTFIADIIKSGFSEKLAEAALRHVKPDHITEGIIWCNDHLDEEDTFGEKEDTDGDDPTKEAISYEGWKKSDQSSVSLTASIVNKLVVAKGDMDVDPLIKDMEVVWEEFLASVSSSVSDYLSVEHLGLILRRLAEKDQRQINRPFPPSFDTGTPNLIICPKADVFSTVLSIYMMDANQPLPQADEVLMCTPQTTLDQLDVFWRRTVADTSSKIHCLVNGDLLDFEVSDRGERRLEQYIQESKHLDLQYRLVVICSAENEYKSQMITALDKFRQPPLPIPDVHYIADYVRKKLQEKEGRAAATVDFDSSTVRVVKSWRAGVGKSLYVKRRNEELMQKNPHHKMTDLVNIPLQEKEINIFQVTQILLAHTLPPGVTTPRIFHLDIAHEVQEGVDFFLFNLLILGCLTDKSGYVWRRSPRDLYLIETMPIIELIQAKKGSSANYVHHVFDFLPFLTCRSPQECLDILINRPKPKGEDFIYHPLKVSHIVSSLEIKIRALYH